MKKFLLLSFYLLIYQIGNCQQFAQKQYSCYIDSNIVYATDTNYLGYEEQLTMNIYKPIGDNNLKRPILIYVHGGSWLGGVPGDYYPHQISLEFAKRGYVVANIQYRMGMHTNPNITPGANCPLTAGNAACAYVSDTAEVLRASFRAMQDAKSAIRYMKSRHEIDSTCIDACFISGESAGAFTALGATFLDKESERFSSCNALANASPTNTPLAFCQLLFNHLPAGQQANYARPDLGSVHGKTNLNGYNDKVKGVAAFYGAIFTEGLTNNWLNGPDTPFIYMFHQGNDFVVSCNTSPPIMPVNQCIPYINFGVNDCIGFSNTPIAYGSCVISSYFQSIGFSNYKFEFINNWIGNPLIDCANTSQPGQGHNIDYVTVRCDSVAKQFSPIAVAAINDCKNNKVENLNRQPLYISPNPFTNKIMITKAPTQPIHKIEVKNIFGQKIPFTTENQNTILNFNSDLKAGVYIITVSTAQSKLTTKILKQNLN
jgi:hypothetical protein